MATFVYLANSPNCLVEIDHPDVYQTHCIEGDKVIVKCLGGESVVVGILVE